MWIVARGRKRNVGSWRALWHDGGRGRKQTAPFGALMSNLDQLADLFVLSYVKRQRSEFNDGVQFQRCLSPFTRDFASCFTVFVDRIALTRRMSAGGRGRQMNGHTCVSSGQAMA
jgi:hypothetical protein